MIWICFPHNLKNLSWNVAFYMICNFTDINCSGLPWWIVSTDELCCVTLFWTLKTCKMSCGLFLKWLCNMFLLSFCKNRWWLWVRIPWEHFITHLQSALVFLSLCNTLLLLLSFIPLNTPDEIGLILWY